MSCLKKLVLSLILVAPAMALAVDDKVNINTADKSELTNELIGITTQQAKNIIEYRKEHGRFHRIEDLELVEDIRYDVMNINRPNIVVD